MTQGRSYLAVLIALLSLLGCQSTRTLVVSDGNVATSIYEGGVPVLKSVKRHTVMVRLLTPEFSKETNALPTLYVGVANGGDAPFDLSTANITAASGPSAVRVLTFEEVQKRVRHDASMMALALALNGASQSMAAAAPQQSYTSGSASAYGSGGYAHGTYSSATTTYNPAATAAAQAQINANTQRQMSMIAGARDSQLNSLDSMLRRETVLPGAFAGGAVKLHPETLKRGQQLVLHVVVADEDHVFGFDVGP